MTVDELRAEADKLGYYITKKRPCRKAIDKRCRDCIWLDMSEKHTIGYKCKNPNKQFRTETAQFKYPHMACCTLFAERSEERRDIDA